MIIQRALVSYKVKSKRALWNSSTVHSRWLSVRERNTSVFDSNSTSVWLLLLWRANFISSSPSQNPGDSVWIHVFISSSNTQSPSFQQESINSLNWGKCSLALFYFLSQLTYTNQKNENVKIQVLNLDSFEGHSLTCSSCSDHFGKQLPCMSLASLCFVEVAAVLCAQLDYVHSLALSCSQRFVQNEQIF